MHGVGFKGLKDEDSIRKRFSDAFLTSNSARKPVLQSVTFDADWAASCLIGYEGLTAIPLAIYVGFSAAEWPGSRPKVPTNSDEEAG
jgi:hypothetical protein